MNELHGTECKEKVDSLGVAKQILVNSYTYWVIFTRVEMLGVSSNNMKRRLIAINLVII